MNAQELIDELKAQGITLQWDGASINWEAPFDFVPSAEIVALVKKNWHEIIKRIDGPPPEWLLSGTNIVRLTQGDCLGAMEMYPDNLVDLIVTDPPYGYQFMGKDWDKAVPSVEIWKECLRVLKPGGFAFIMSAPRQDVLARMIINLEEAGFKTGFTSLYWTYASGFPKAHNISKAIDKKAGVKPNVVTRNPNSRENCDISSTIYESGTVGKTAYITAPVTPEAKALDGSYGGFQPKPAVEVIIIAQKPLSEKTFVDQALSNKKGITWLDDCRIPYADKADTEQVAKNFTGDKYDVGINWSDTKKLNNNFNNQGRFPANLLISDKVLDDGLDHTSHPMDCEAKNEGGLCYGKYSPHREFNPGDTGGYARFFSLDAWSNQKIAEGLDISDLEKVDRNVLPFLIVPKASTKEKNFGCESLTPQQVDKSRNDPNAIGCNNPRNRGGKQRKNYHPTVKPALLMSYLITMGSREGDIVLDPFCGSGTTCLAARLLKRPCIGIEKDPGYFNIAAARMRALNLLSHIQTKPKNSTVSNSAVPLKTEEEKTQKSKKTTKGWDIIKIKNVAGEQVDAVAPLIISASRRNDTPAHHSQWFMDGFKRGHLGVSNKIKYVSFEKTRLIVFWTKNPEHLMEHLYKLDKEGVGYYFQYTLNDYDSEGMEPEIPPLKDRIATFKELSDKISPEKVIWRFDPLILTDKITKEQLVEKVENLMEELKNHTEKLVISFYRSGDYDHALKRMQTNQISPIDFQPEDITFVAGKIGALGKKFNMKVATCADEGDLSLYGIEHNKCIDDALIKRVFRDDEILMNFLNSRKKLKDPGQRKKCKCIVSEDVGKKNTCANGCLYCYANQSDNAVKKNLGLIKQAEIGEFIVLQKPKKFKN